MLARLQLLSATAGSAVLTWPADAGLTYQVQTSTNLSTTNWMDVGSSFTATGTVLTATNAIGADQQRFYRVRLLP